jgi:hypothetical protein
VIGQNPTQRRLPRKKKNRPKAVWHISQYKYIAIQHCPSLLGIHLPMVFQQYDPLPTQDTLALKHLES